MMDNKHQEGNRSGLGIAQIIGTFLIAGGGALLLEQRLKTGWLILLLVPAIGLTFLLGGIRWQKKGYVIPGGIITGIGVGLFFFLSPLVHGNWQTRVGLLLMAAGAGFLLIPLVSYLSSRRITWWAMITGTLIAAVGAAFSFTPLRVTDFVLYIVTGLGLVLLLWGVSSRLFGLIIPGCLLIGIGPGIYTAWSGVTSEPSGLSRTGIMLVCFALGFGLITVFSRVVTDQFIWWPLIPGGVLAVVGWGLYIGGNPDNALSFIGNTGSIGLIIFGVYLLLLRRGIHN